MAKSAMRVGLVGVSLGLLIASCGGKVDPSGDGGAGGSPDGGGSGGSGAGAGGTAGTSGGTGGSAGTSGGSGGTAGKGGNAGTGGSAGAPNCQGQIDPNKKYVSHDPKQCALIDYVCPPNARPFTDECGCGCGTINACDVIECFRAVECVTSCGGPVVQSGCCPCVAPAFDDILCQSDGGTCSCLTSKINWGPDGGLVAYRDTSSLVPCRTYQHQRTAYASTTTPLSCAQEAACETPAVIAKLLANPDVQAALKAAPVLYGTDPRPVDGTVFRIEIDGKIIDVGMACSSGCKAIPAGVEALRQALIAIDRRNLSQGKCGAVFPAR